MKTDFTPKNTGLMFKAEMILAYLEKRKNQTRRVKGLQLVNENPDDWQLIFKPEHEGVRFVSFGHKSTQQVVHLNMPYGGINDTLYFKETYRMWAGPEYGEGYVHYRADDAKVRPTWWNDEDWLKVHSGWFEKWNSSMFMPRRFSRFREVPIVDVRAERLQDITQEDAWYEGIQRTPDLSESAHLFKDPTHEYFALWDTINGRTLPASKNPWVWVYQFPLHQQEQSNEKE
jgi:hypothetical protein